MTNQHLRSRRERRTGSRPRALLAVAACVALVASGWSMAASTSTAAGAETQTSGLQQSLTNQLTSQPAPADIPVAPEPSLPDVPVTELIVKYRAGTKPVTTNGQATGADTLGVKARPAGKASDGFRRVELEKGVSNQRAIRLAEKLAKDPDVVSAIPNLPIFPTEVLSPVARPNDTYYGQQWPLGSYGPLAASNQQHIGVQAQYGWARTTGVGSAPIVAVLDSGITDHPDLAGRVMFDDGYDFVSSVLQANDGNARDNNAHDPGDWVTSAESTTAGSPFEGCEASNSSWHGTHVAGTIGAIPDNNIGVAGLVWDARILPVRILGKCGGGLFDLLDAITWASGGTVNGMTLPPEKVAKVLNLSIGGIAACFPQVQQTIDAAVERGSVVVVSAGNSSIDTANAFPANCNNVVTVAATDPLGYRAPYSNYGSVVEIAAPGGGDESGTMVASTWNVGQTSPGNSAYAYMSGTSMAAPHVSGAAALYAAANPTATPAQVSAALQASATPFPAGSRYGAGGDRRCVGEYSCGAGMLNLAGLLNVDSPPGPAVQASASVTDSSSVTVNFNEPASGTTFGIDVIDTAPNPDAVLASAVSESGIAQIPVTSAAAADVAYVVGSNGIGSGVVTEVPVSSTGFPAAPSLQVTPGDGELSVQWSAPASVGLSDIQVYRVLIDDQHAYQFAVNQTSLQVTGLTNDQAHTVKVWAVNFQGSSAAAVQSATPEAPPPPEPEPEPNSSEPSEQPSEQPSQAPSSPAPPVTQHPAPPAPAPPAPVKAPQDQGRPSVKTKVRKGKSFTIAGKTSAGLPVTVKSSKASVCKVAKSGSKWKLTGKKKGTCTLTITAPGNGNVKSLRFTVKIKVA